MATIVESFESLGISRSFYTGGLVRVANHSGMIFSLNDGGLSIVDPLTGRTYARIEVENDPIFSFAVNPKDNSDVVTVGKSNLCRHWSVSGPHEVVMLRAWASGHVHPVLCMDLSHDGSLVATASVDRTIRVFALPGYYSVAVYKVAMQDPISIIRFFRNRRALASLGSDNAIAVWDLDQLSLQEPVRELKGHMSTLHAIAFSEDGSRMFTSGNDQMVMTWDLSQFPAIVLASQVAVFESVQAVLPLGASGFVTGGDKGEIRVWSGKKCICTVKSGHGAAGHLKYLFQLPQSGEVVAVGADLCFSIWSVSADFSLSYSRQLMGNMGEILSVKFFDKDRLVCALNDEFPRIVNASNFSVEAKLEGHTDICLSVATAGSRIIATGSKDQSIRIWDASTLECTAHLTGHAGPVNFVVFTKKQDQIVSGSEDGCVKIWRVQKKKGEKFIVRSIMAHAKSVSSLAISANDRFIASGSQDRTAKVFSLEDGSLVATCSGHKGSIWGVDFSPIEQILATSSRDGTVKLWNLTAPGAPCIRTLEGHDTSVMACRFFDSGLQVISADAAGTMRLWNVRSGECALIAMTDGEVVVTEKKSSSSSSAVDDFTESESAAKIWCLDVAKNYEGKTTLVSGTNSGTLNLWLDNTAKLALLRSKDEADKAEKDTSIQVLLKAGRFNDAFKAAFDLNRPKLMLEVLKEANWTAGSAVNVDKFIRQSQESSKDKMQKILQEWQKSAKNCAVAYSLVTRLAPETLQGIDCEKFQSFSEKHMQRLSSLSQKCYIIDAILLASESSLASSSSI